MKLEDLVEEISSENDEFSRAIEKDKAFYEFCSSVRAELVKLRRAAKLNQDDVAERLGMSQSAISRMERGIGDVGLATVARYASALGLRPVVAFGPLESNSHRVKEGLEVAKTARRSAEIRLRKPFSDQADRWQAIAQRSVSDAAEEEHSAEEIEAEGC